MNPPAITLEVLPAGYGDCLMISCPVGERTWRLQVNTGPDECWPTLGARLEKIAPDTHGKRHIDLAVISHIDHDHIGGASLLFSDKSLGLTFGDVWFNAPLRPKVRGVAEGHSLATPRGKTPQGSVHTGGGRPNNRGHKPFLILVDCFLMKQPIPPTVEDVYEFLKKEITWLHGRWIIFEQLYNKSPTRIELLNETASTFFYILQRMMLDDLQLSLSKLTDPAPGKGSLKQLQQRLEKHGNERLAAQAAEVLKRLVERVQPFRTWRDKQIAHYDLAVALDRHVEPMPDVYYRELHEALRLVREYMNLVERHYHDSEQVLAPTEN